MQFIRKTVKGLIEPRGHLISRLNMIVRVNVVLIRTFVGSDEEGPNVNRFLHLRFLDPTAKIFQEPSTFMVSLSMALKYSVNQEPKDHCTFFIVAYALSPSNDNPNQPHTSTVYRFHKVEKQVFNERLKVTTQKKIKQKVDSPQNELEYAVNNDEGK